jgi:MFS family permease
MSGTLDVSVSPSAGASMGLLAKERTIASAGFNRWLVPPAALCIHLCIGMAYGFSVFWLPLSKAIGISKPVECPAGMSFIESVFSSSCDWKVSTLGWMYTLFFVFLGSAAALWGGWLERVGPRKAAFVSALCWCGGLVISAIGVYLHQIWMLWLGSGVIGGIGLGLGYISPVSTLIKWFPDRRGMATGMAIMGFGGGAMIGSPLADRLMKLYATPDSVGVWQTFVTMAAIYLVFMMLGAFGYRIPPTGWKPAGWTPPSADTSKAMITTRHVHLKTAWKTPQFWQIWGVLCLNVSAGIGIIGIASVMLQEIFGGFLVARPELGFAQVQADTALKAAAAAVGAGFVGVISLFNIGGRFFWASLSDKLGRKLTYFIFFVLGILLYFAMPEFAAAKSMLLFVLAFGVIASMYGGGFATIPAYLADIFGTQMVGAIHGRLLTAWSVAGILGPVLVNYLREARIAANVPRDHVYDMPLMVLAGLLVIGFVCNFMIKPVDPKYYMSEADLEEERRLAHERTVAVSVGPARADGAPSSPALLIGAWLLVGIPILWGVWVTLQKASALF